MSTSKLDDLLGKLGADSSDEEKFASLYIIGKTIDLNDEEMLKKIFLAMNFKFLDRLIKAGTKHNNSKIENIEEKKALENQYENMGTLGLNILLHFYQIETLATSDILLIRIPLLINYLILNNNQSHQNETEMIFKVLLKLSKTSLGAQALCKGNNQSIPILLMFDEHKKFNLDLETQLLTIFENMGNTLFSNRKELSSEFINEFNLSYILTQIIPLFPEVQLKNQPYLIEGLTAWLRAPTSIVTQLIPPNASSKVIWQALYEGISRWISQRSRSSYRNATLILSDLLLKHFGFGWLDLKYAPPQTQSHIQDQEQEQQKPHNQDLPSFLIRLACVEVRSSLETLPLEKLMTHKSEPTESDSTAIGELSHAQNDEMVLLASLNVVFHYVQYLAIAINEADDESETEEAIESEERRISRFEIPYYEALDLGDTNPKLEQILMWLRETYLDILFFLVDAMEIEGMTERPLLLKLVSDLCLYLNDDPSFLFPEFQAKAARRPPIEKLISLLAHIYDSYQNNTLAQSTGFMPSTVPLIAMTFDYPETLQDAIHDHRNELVHGLLSWIEEEIGMKPNEVPLGSKSIRWLSFLERYDIAFITLQLFEEMEDLEASTLIKVKNLLKAWESENSS